MCRKRSGRNLFALIYHHRLYKAETGSLKDVFRYFLIHLMNRSTKIGELYIDRWIGMRSRRIRTNRFGNWRRFAPVGFPTLQFLGAWMRIAKAITCDTNIYVDSILYSVYIYICIHIHIYGKEGTNNKDAYEKTILFGRFLV